MAREDEQLDNEDSRVEQLETEVSKLRRSLKRKENRRLFGCFSCLMTLLFISIVSALCITYVLVKSGLREIPYLSSWLYHEVTPVYLVEMPKADPLADLQQLIGESLASGAGSGGQLALELSDSQLTALLRQEIKSKLKVSDKIEYAQVAVKPEMLELYVQPKYYPKAILKVQLLPQLQDNKIDLQIKEFRLGDLPLPRFAGNLMFVYLTEASVNNFLNIFTKIGRVESLELREQSLVLHVVISDILNFKNLFKL